MKDHPSYRILDLLGESSSTRVYQAWDDSPLQREVAIKMLRDDQAEKPQVRKTFWERVKVMSNLRHDRLLPVYSIDTERDWVILELADGSAATRLAAGKVPASDVASFVAQAAEGLQALHASGRLHGQIKPTNLLLYKSGRLKLADPGALIDGDLQLTPGGEKYLAPELADPDRWGKKAPGPQLDFYTLGFCALEMLAGPEFESLIPGMNGSGADKASLWWKWHASADDPRAIVAKVLPTQGHPLRTTLEKMLAKRVEERPKDAAEIIAMIGAGAVPPELRVEASPHPASSEAVRPPPQELEARITPIPTASSRGSVTGGSSRSTTSRPPTQAATESTLGSTPRAAVSHPGRMKWIAASVSGILVTGLAAFFLAPAPEHTIRVVLPKGTGPAEVSVDGKPASLAENAFRVRIGKGVKVGIGIVAKGCKPLQKGEYTRAELEKLGFSLRLEPEPIVKTVVIDAPAGTGPPLVKIDGKDVPVVDTTFSISLLPEQKTRISVEAEGCEPFPERAYSIADLDTAGNRLKLIAKPVTYTIRLGVPEGVGPVKVLADGKPVEVKDGAVAVSLLPSQTVWLAVDAEGCDPIPSKEYTRSEFADPTFRLSLVRKQPVPVDHVVRVEVPDGASSPKVTVNGAEMPLENNAFHVALVPEQVVRIGLTAEGCEGIASADYTLADLEKSGFVFSLTKQKPASESSGDLTEDLLF